MSKFNKVSKKMFKIVSDENLEFFMIDKWWFKSILIISIIVLTYYAVKFNKLILIHGSDQARIIRFSVGTLFRSTKEAIIYNWVFPTLASTYACILSNRIINRKFKKLTTYLLIINLILYFMVGYGRFLVLEVLVYCLINYLLFSNNKKGIMKLLKEKLYIYIVIIVSFVLGVFITAKRVGMLTIDITMLIKTVDLFLKQIIIYFIGPFRALDIGINTFFNEHYFQMGRVTVGGIEEIIKTPFIILGYDINLFNDILGNLTQSNINIGENEVYNAFYTANIGYMLDFGIAGVVIFPVIFGLLYGYISIRFFENKNSESFLIFLYGSYCLFMTVLRPPFQNISPWIFFAMCTIISIFKKYKIRI